MSRHLSDWLEGYLEFTDNSEPPEIFRRWTGISIIASLLQRKCSITWGGTFFPNLYIVLVAPSGTARKGTALNQGLGFLLDPNIGVHIAVDSTSRASFIRDMKGSQDIYIDEEKMLHTHSSLTVYSEELTVFLGYQDLQLITDLINWYDSFKNPWIHKTISGKEQAIPGVWLNILGATTPDLLKAALPLEAIGGGLISRMILVYRSRRSKIVADGFPLPRELELKELLSQDALEIVKLGGGFKITPQCLDAYVEWYSQFDWETECKDDRFKAYFSRKATTVKKLCMILSASSRDNKVITEEDFRRSLEYLGEVETTMYFALEGMGRNQYAKIMHQIMAEILRTEGCTMQHLMYRFRDEVTKFELDNIMRSLDAMKFCTVYENTGKVIPNREFNHGS